MQTLLSNYGYIMLFVASFFEWQFSTLFSGVLIWTGHFNLWIAFLVIIFADISNDTLYYLIGRGVLKSKKISNFVDQSKFLSRNMTTMKKLWTNHPFRTMLLGKNAYIISIAIVASAGAVKMSYLRFLSYSIPSALIQPIVLLSIGYFLWNWYSVAIQYLPYPGIVIAIILVIIVFTYRSVGKRVAQKFEK